MEVGAVNLVHSYPEDLEETLCSELIQFRDLMKSDTLPSNPWLEHEAHESNHGNELRAEGILMKHQHIEQTFPNVETALQIYLS
jgi:hypothetical protein